ncbi:MAG: hypothetical protein LBJ91_00255 [Clostridiales Family XIII bacterium]|nr:hypothetical protein [Clostridiales Family XIII bacterium]
MTTNDKKIGYSEALGGYGVPAQVEITGDAGGTGKSAKPRRGKGLVFRPKPRNIVAIAAIAVAVAMAILFLAGAFDTLRYAGSIDNVRTEAQQVNGVDATIYRPIIAEDVGWNDASKNKRDGIARYSVKKVLADEIGAGQEGIFSILGQTSDGQPAFFYSPNADTIQVFVNGAVEDAIPLE